MHTLMGNLSASACLKHIRLMTFISVVTRARHPESKPFRTTIATLQEEQSAINACKRVFVTIFTMTAIYVIRSHKRNVLACSDTLNMRSKTNHDKS
jgi:hypothetical protein